MSSHGQTRFTSQHAQSGFPVRSPTTTLKQAADQRPPTPSATVWKYTPRDYHLRDSHAPPAQKPHWSFLRSFFSTGADRLLISFAQTYLLFAMCIFLHHVHGAVLALCLYVNAAYGSPATLRLCQILRSQMDVMDVMDTVHFASVWAPVAFWGEEYGRRIWASTGARLWLLGMEVLLLGAEVGGRWVQERENFLPRS